MIYHSIELNVQKNTSKCRVEVYEKDRDSHQLLIKLVTDNGYFDASDYSFEIEFYDSSTRTKVLTSVIDIVNPSRGYLSYILGERIVRNPGRYTVVLNMTREVGSSSPGRCNCHCPSQNKCTFVLNVLRDPSGSGCNCNDNVEVTISKEFYEELERHLDNRSAHVSPSDRVVLKFLEDNLDDLVTKDEIEDLTQSVEETRESVGQIDEKVVEVENNVADLQEGLNRLDWVELK